MHGVLKFGDASVFAIGVWLVVFACAFQSAAFGEGAAYAILGTLFPTPSKPGHAGRGIEWLRGSLSPRIELPVFAIGGIDVSRAAAARDAGAHGVAVCGAILGAPDPGAATARLLESVGRD